MAIVLLIQPFVLRRVRCRCVLLELPVRACSEKRALRLYGLPVEGAPIFTKRLFQVTSSKAAVCLIKVVDLFDPPDL